MRIQSELQEAYVLHARPFRNTSLLLELFTLNEGRVGVVARGARGPSSKIQGLLQPFVPLMVRFAGRGELLTLQQVEAAHRAVQLRGERLITAFYLNELLIRLLLKHDPHCRLFHQYQQVLSAIETAADIEPCLRIFEKNLLIELGYGVVLDREAYTNHPIRKEVLYHYQHHIGFIELKSQEVISEALIFSGENLINFQHDQLDTSETLNAAKRLMRLALSHLLGGRALKTRELF